MAGERRRASASEMAAIKGPYDVDSAIGKGSRGRGRGGNQLPSHMNYDKLLMRRAQVRARGQASARTQSRTKTKPKTKMKTKAETKTNGQKSAKNTVTMAQKVSAISQNQSGRK